MDENQQSSQGALRMRVVDWMAWADGVETREAWATWAAGDEVPTPETPESFRFIPSRLRRRMSLLTKTALYTARHCLGEHTPTRVVFASRHGELPRTLGLLEAMAGGGVVSPAHFSHSVHNTTAGLFSIMEQCKAPGTAVAAGQDTFFCALVEAAGWLQNHPDELILVVIADQPLPAAYKRFADEDEMAYALSLLLAPPAREGSSQELLGQPIAMTTPPRLDNTPALGFLRWWLAGQGDWHLNTQQQQTWRWSEHGRNS